MEGIERTKEIHLSDLYSVIHSVPGVRSVKNLCLNTDVTHVPLPHLDCGDEKPWPQAEWRFRLLQNAAPIFLFDNTSLTNISLSTATGAIPVNKRKAHAELTRYQKSYLSDSFLDML
ncbi:MAG TPA: hypothetical protein PK198_10345, partial [Saprospiraceae bacterium]|nr:hypothetical protein [Saprospiraceae bacterium]